MSVREPEVADLLEILERDNLFLTGAAGTGKSWMTARVIEAYKARDRSVVALGSTGVSAVHIGGVTLHSFLVLGICNTLEELVEQDRRNKGRLRELKKLLQATDLIVIDEVSMIGAETLEMIRYRLESLDYRGRVMFVGDFFQLPPVRSAPVGDGGLFGGGVYAFESPAWEVFAPVTVELRRMQRTRDEEFTRILSRIRRGIWDAQVQEYLEGLLSNEGEFLREATWLYGRNREVEQRNRRALESLEGPEFHCDAELELHEKVHPRRLESWRGMLPVSDRLTLKRGAPVLFGVNRWGHYVNGERGVVHNVDDGVPIVEKEERFVRVSPHEFVLGEPALDEKGRVQMRPLATFRQVPLRLAYAVTIHKAQGMSLEALVCNLDTIFAPSQFYVALSRAVDPRKLRLECSQRDRAGCFRRLIHVDPRVVRWYEREFS